ncbi:unnamed protein product [Rotaria magnacalcarata]|uniref:Uncharacterized protein n=1 Tax=Rotaria magnacalcarata TaxID=392030 RepID=A0A8S3HK19_9BILA|nr:unnamed protein product [Rotaria magnacalcarata]
MDQYYDCISPYIHDAKKYDHYRKRCNILKCGARGFRLNSWQYNGKNFDTERTILGFGDRLLGELKRIAPKEVKIKISAPRERLYSTWIGGSILASLDTFKKIWVTKREYDTEGAKVIHRKTF